MRQDRQLFGSQAGKEMTAKTLQLRKEIQKTSDKIMMKVAKTQPKTNG